MKTKQLFTALAFAFSIMTMANISPNKSEDFLNTKKSIINEPETAEECAIRTADILLAENLITIDEYSAIVIFFTEFFIENGTIENINSADVRISARSTLGTL